jgi:large subunit ribosomal protein L17
MRHRKRGRILGRSSSHRKALLRNLASSLILTERDAELADNAPRVKGRVVTTLHKAKEVRPLVEKCVTIARKSLIAEANAEQFSVDANRGTDAWKSWRKSDNYQKWNNAIAPAVAGRRRALKLLGDKQAVSVLFSEIAPRMADREGGYTRIMRLAKPRLGDGGTQAMIEFVGRNDRVSQKSEKPAFVGTDEDDQRSVEDLAPPTMEAEAGEVEAGEASESDSNVGESEKATDSDS